MSDTALEAVLRRDRVVVIVALAIITALAWADLVWLADDMAMSGMDMTGYRMIPAGRALMILIYARVGRQAANEGKPFAGSAWFAGGYLLAWTAFSLVATSAQWALERAALLTPLMESASNRLGAAVLILAGVYQWAPLKDACLSHCRSPLLFIQQHGGFRREPLGALALGFRHGIYCIGCCWALMALLFVGGVMNLFWIATLAILVLFEKVVPFGRVVARAAGLAFIAGGVWLMLQQS
jgi:predicted metal-binding membrane protein